MHHHRENQVNYHHLRESKTKRVGKSFHREKEIERERGLCMEILEPYDFRNILVASTLGGQIIPGRCGCWEREEFRAPLGGVPSVCSPQEQGLAADYSSFSQVVAPSQLVPLCVVLCLCVTPLQEAHQFRGILAQGVSSYSCKKVEPNCL